MFVRAAVLIVGLAVGGCSSGHSCKLGATCEEVAGKDDKALAGQQHDCEAMQGTWASSSCPSAGRIGTCAAPGAFAVVYYGEGPDAFTVATATANCEHERHGTWTPAK